MEVCVYASLRHNCSWPSSQGSSWCFYQISKLLRGAWAGIFWNSSLTAWEQGRGSIRERQRNITFAVSLFFLSFFFSRRQERGQPASPHSGHEALPRLALSVSLSLFVYLSLSLSPSLPPSRHKHVSVCVPAKKELQEQIEHLMNKRLL